MTIRNDSKTIYVRFQNEALHNKINMLDGEKYAFSSNAPESII